MVNQLAIIVPLLLAATLSAQQYTKHAGLNCYKGHGGRNIDSGPAKLSLTVSECEKRCDATPDCYCVVMTANTTSSHAGSCWRRSMCQPAACSSDSLFNAFIKPGAPTPPPGLVMPGSQVRITTHPAWPVAAAMTRTGLFFAYRRSPRARTV